MNEFDPASEIAMYYGFAPIQSPRVSRGDRDDTAALQAYDRSLFMCAPEEKCSLLRLYARNRLQDLSHPTMVCYHRPGNVSGVGSSNCVHFGLDIIGTNESVADALAIRTACAILANEGYSDLIVDLNSIGDRDSLQRFETALQQFYRNHIAHLPPKWRQVLSNNVFDVLQSDDPTVQQLNESAPQAVSTLNEHTREHFMQILEHLEEAGIAYRIHNALAGNKHLSSHTVFAIRSVDADGEEETLAMGTRYNRLSRKIKMGADISAVGVSLTYRPRRSSPRSRKTPLVPRHFFCQLGGVAKRRSFPILDELRAHRIPVLHTLVRNKIRSQLEFAEEMDIPYVIIMGQKETMENAVVVRNMRNREQETVPVDELVHYIKNYAK